MTNELKQARHAEIADHIRDATLEVFSTMLPMDIAIDETAAGNGLPGNRPGGVNALFGLTGAWSGSGQFSCTPELACRIAAQMPMSEYETVDEDVLDAIAEVANMIIGNVKNMLEVGLGPMGLSVPTIVFGEQFETRVAGNPDPVVVSFTSGDDTMTVLVVLAPGKSEVRGRHTSSFALAGP